MINQVANWDSIQESTERLMLPLGAYVCRVTQSSVVSSDYGDQIVLVFDICEGEFSGYYAEEFKNNPNTPKKWKGVYRQFLPKNDGSDPDEWAKSRLKGLVTAFERSNPGFKWAWDEQSLVGKIVGILMRREEWEWNGKTGWAIRPFRAMSADKVRNAEYTLPKDKPLKDKAAATPAYAYNTITTSNPGSFAPASDWSQFTNDDDELPF